ncbi:retron St85 family effector protein [Mangrovibacter yixingensis]|uniref:retron St85 family effector protein n=1 Tax=Mangrovibacter yixingensis TaxID=1529639 RepID=UPI001CFC726F|nr:retron St85 family effector protein [Mangrovibacter yixingensis]
MEKNQKEKYEEKLKKHVSGWELKNFRVCYDEQIIFLCGAKVAPFHEPQTTMRGMFYKFCKENDSRLFNKLLLAEAFKNYLKDSHYPDLISFEKDIANLSSLIIIFLESSGSIAELGLFCNLDDINKKLLVIVPEHEVQDVKKESFIYLGPLSYLREKVNNKSYIVYPGPVDGKDYNEHLELILDDVKSLAPSDGKEYKFDVNNSGHLAFLLTHIISLAMPIRLKEIMMCVNELGINATMQKDIERMLFLLETFFHIEVYEYGGTKYYYTKSSKGSIRLGKNKSGFTVDEVGIKADLLLFINDAARCDDKKRRLALNSIKERINEHN